MKKLLNNDLQPCDFFNVKKELNSEYSIIPKLKYPTDIYSLV